MSPPLRLAADEIASVVLRIGHTPTLVQSRLVARAFCCETPQALQDHLLRNWRARGKKLKWWLVARDGSPLLLCWMLSNRPRGQHAEKSLYSATKAGRLDMLQWFKRYGPDRRRSWDDTVRMLLSTAAKRGHVHIVKWMMQTAEVDKTCIMRSLAVAVYTRRRDMVDVLLAGRESDSRLRNFAETLTISYYHSHPDSLGFLPISKEGAAKWRKFGFFWVN